MKLKLNKEDSDDLNRDGFIVLDIELTGKPVLLLITSDGLQMLADSFSAGNTLKIGQLEIKGNADRGMCPCCRAEKEETQSDGMPLVPMTASEKAFLEDLFLKKLDAMDAVIPVDTTTANEGGN